MFNVTADGARIQNLVIDGANNARIGVHVFKAGATTPVAIDNVEAKNLTLGFCVNGSVVNANNVKASGNAWGGVNVDAKNAPATLSIDGANTDVEGTATAPWAAVYVDSSEAYASTVTIGTGAYDGTGVNGAIKNSDSIKATSNTLPLPAGQAWKKLGDNSYEVVEAVASITRNGQVIAFATLADAIDAAQQDDIVVLLKDVTENVTIPIDKNITLDLNGKTLVNDPEAPRANANVYGQKSTIVNFGTLTVTDNSTAKTGAIDNVTHGAATVYNAVGATANLNGGSFKRSMEAGTPTGPNGNSWYVLCNHGTMTIDGATVTSDTTEGNELVHHGFSSLIENGFQGSGVKNAATTLANKQLGAEEPKLTITNGTFSGGINVVKNDDFGHLAISGGTFSNTTDAAVMNWNVGSISGGTFTTQNKAVIVNGSYGANTEDSGQLTISGGTFENKSGGALFGTGLGGTKTEDAKTTVTGGVFRGKVETTGYTLDIQNGTFSQDADETAIEKLVFPTGQSLEPVKIGEDDMFQLKNSLKAFSIAKAKQGVIEELYTGTSVEVTHAELDIKALVEATAPAQTATVDEGDYEIYFSNSEDEQHNPVWQHGTPTEPGTYQAKLVATAEGAYPGTESAVFTITVSPAEITAITVEPASKVYNGVEQVPETIKVKAGNFEIPATYQKTQEEEVANYKIVYAAAEGNDNQNAALGTNGKPVKAGKYTVTVQLDGDTTADGRYHLPSGDTPISTEFVIEQKSIRSSDVTAAIADQAYTGNPIEPTQASVLDDGIETEGKATPLTSNDYSVSYYDNNINVGTASAVIQGMGNYKDKRTVQFNITTNTQLISAANVELKTAGQNPKPVVDNTYTYDGAVKEPVPTVTVTVGADDPTTTDVDESKKVLVADTDYSVDYYNNVDAGTALVYIEGKGGYAGTQIVEFKINKADVVAPTVATGLVYDGNEKTGCIDDEQSKNFYTVTGVAKATAAGNYNATATLNDPANYKWFDGTTQAKELDWSIAPKSVESEGITVVMPNVAYEYDGAAKEPKPEVKDGQTLLNEGTDYELSYDNNTNATTETSKATVTVTGKGNYKDAMFKEFAIGKGVSTIELADQTKTYTGQVINYDTAGTVTTGSKGNVTYAYYSDAQCQTEAEPKNAGTYYVKATVAADDNYAAAESQPATFTIAPATPVVTVTINGWEYRKFNDQQNLPNVTVTPAELDEKITITYYKKGDTTPITADAIKTAPAGEYTVKAAIEATDNYAAAEATADFVIAKQLVTIPTDATSPITYDGAEHTVLPVAENDQYKVLGTNTVTDAGDYIVFAALKDNANYVWADFTTDVKPYELTITPKTLTDAMVANIAPGFEAEPAVSVTDGDKVLVKGTDYDVTYNGNTATVTGKGNYTGIVEKSFTVGTAVAKIGDTLFGTLSEAVSAAKAGDTIQLVDDIALTSTVETSGKNFTLDLNGHNIAATDARALWVKSGDVTITGEGTISAKATDGSGFADSSSVIRVGDTATSDAAKLTVGKDVTVTTDHCYGITVFGKNAEANELVLNGKVAVTGDASAISGNGSAGNAPANITVNEGAKVSATTDAGIYFPSAGTLTINGGTITGPTAVYAKAGTINVKGGTLVGTGAKAEYAYNGNGLNATGDALVADNCNYPEGTNGPTVTLGNVTLTSEHANEVGSYYGNKKEDLSTVISTTTDPITIADNQTWIADGDNYKLVEAVIVTFKDGETTIDSKKIGENTKVAEPADPTKDGYAFAGWFADGATTEFNFGTQITSNTTLTAHWNTEIAAPTAAQNLVYDGTAKTGVTTDKVNYELVNPQPAQFTNTATDAGTYKVQVAPKSGFCWADGTTEPKDVEWTIAPVDLSAAYIEPIDNQTYGAENWNQPAVTVKDASGRDITSDVQVAYANNDGVGLATVTVTPKANNNNYAGQATTQFAINPADSAGVTIETIPAQNYTGSEIKPEVVVKKGNDVVPADITYINNVEPGTATVIATLKGNYSGSATTTFRITGNDKTALTQSVQDAANAQNNTPISTDGSGLPTGMHYVTPEQANALQNAINNANSVLSDPKATADDIAAAKQALDNALNTYNTQKNNQVASNKKAAVPSATNRTYNGSSQTGVPAGEGYTISGNTGTNAGSYTATATLKPGYVWSDGTTGAKKIPWKIAAAPANRVNIAPIGNQPLTDGAIRPAVRVTDSATGKVLVAGKDYDVTYSNNNGPGTATATVTGKGNYAGSKSQNYTIYAPHVSYRTHVQRVGWQQYVSDGDMSGTTGKSYRLEGINIRVSDLPYAGGIQYRTHVQRIGWQDWRYDDQMSGTSGMSRRLEAIEIKLTGEMANHYDVYYRVHCQRFGWMGWAKNGERSGSAGYSRRLEGIQIVLVRKGDAAPGATYKGITQNVSRCFAQK